jgi:alpha-mannosidase
LQEIPKTRLASPAEFFQEFEKRGIPEARYTGELYFEGHRGTYTTQAKTKKGNRKSEFALREAELWSAAAMLFTGKAYPAGRLEENWKKILLNQFHDIIPGSSIARVYEEANNLYEDVLEEAGTINAEAVGAMSKKPDGPSETLTVWNSLSWTRDIVVETVFKDGLNCANTADGGRCATQVVERDKTKKLLVKVPAVDGLGAKAFSLSRGPAGPSPSFSQDKSRLENEHLVVKLNETGEIVSLIDKSCGREIVKQGRALNELLMFRDQPGDWDAWDIDITYKKNPVVLSRKAEVMIVHSGPVETRIRVQRTIGKSRLVQEIVLRPGEARIDLETVIDWQESRKLLKTAFAADIRTDFAKWEIQFGHIKRPLSQNSDQERSRFEVSGHKYMDLSEAGYGVSILNDCKYGWDCLDGIPKLTLLRAPIAPDENADRGTHSFTYSIFVHTGPFGIDTVRQGYEINTPVTVSEGSVKPAASRPLFTLDEDNIIVETVKRSEDGKSIVVRIYESIGQATVCNLKSSFPFKKALACNLIEEEDKEVPSAGGVVKVELHTFGIRTFKFVL